jgi:nicotinate phosphoribosyltransferase
MQPVIQSLLDTDLYKFTMWQTMLHRHPQTQAEYTFVCRNQPAYPLALLVDERQCRARLPLHAAVSAQGARLSQRAAVHPLGLRPTSCGSSSSSASSSHARAHGDQLEIVANGPQVHVMAFEIHVLAIVNEAVLPPLRPDRRVCRRPSALAAKVERLAAFAKAPKQRHRSSSSDFGVRRRFCRDWQREVVETFKREVPQYFKGVSNVMFARELGLVPIGTMAHEYLQTYQTLGVRLRDFQRAAFEDWVQEYRGDLGVALTDVVGMDAFLADFDLYFAKLFDGLRHDSGDPVTWGEKALAHYERLRIDANTKRLTFSDGLDFDKSIALYRHFADRTQLGFGIGTNLTNDMGLKTLHIVMKLTHANGQPVAKLSDSPGARCV